MSSHTFIYPEILTLDNQQGFSDEFLAALKSDNVFEGMLNILEMKTYGVWAFPCLKKDFCTKLIQDLEAAERNPALRITRPNSMNRYGIIMKGKFYFNYYILDKYLFNSPDFRSRIWPVNFCVAGALHYNFITNYIRRHRHSSLSRFYRKVRVFEASY